MSALRITCDPRDKHFRKEEPLNSSRNEAGDLLEVRPFDFAQGEL